MSYVGLVLGPHEWNVAREFSATLGFCDDKNGKYVSIFFYFNKEKSLQATACEQAHQLIWESITRSERSVGLYSFMNN